MYRDLHLYISGEFLGAHGRQVEQVLNPATEEVIGELPHATDSDLDDALAAAASGFETWRRMSAYDRGRILKDAATALRGRAKEVGTMLTLEQGKPLAEAEGEVLVAADILEWSAEEGRRTYGRIVPGRTPGGRQMVLAEPVGPAAAFTPWNFPALTPARKIGSALAAGCSLILKPSEETPATALEIVKALHEAGLPKGVLNVVFGAPSRVSERLIASPVIRKVSFTGSTAVGKHLQRLSVDYQKRTTMELGGHAPVLVFADADIEKAAIVAAAGKFRNAGQVCIAPTRFYVEEGAYDAFIDHFVGFAGAIRLGPGLEKGTTMGPLANARRVDAIETIVADARERGGEIRIGGERSGNRGYYFEPTVVTGLPDDSLIMSEEPFGPVAPITLFRGFDEVISRANALPFGLAAYAFTRSTDTAARVADALQAGMVGINSLAVSTPETPFGGVKASGHGQEGGTEGLVAYQNVKFVAHY